MEECKPLLRGGPAAVHGRAVQVDPIKPTLKAPGAEPLKPECDKPLSNFAFNFNLRRHITGCATAASAAYLAGRCSLPLSSPT